MSGSSFGFSQPTSPTKGLQNYDLERGVKNLAPGTAFFSVLRLRAARRRKLANRGGQQRKDIGMTDMIKSMVGTLSQSVLGIVDSGADNHQDLLKQSFAEFTAAVEQHVAGELAKRAPEPDLLYKGLGTISRVAGVVSHLSDRISCIKSGKDWDGQDDKKADPASADVVAFLEHALAAAELALRQAVNEHVEIADDEDVAEKMAPGTTLMVLKSADGKDFRVKTTLPDELAKLACDPALLDQQMIDDAASILATFGANETVLSKLFDDDATLAKAFGAVQPDNTAGGTEGAAAPANDPTAGQPDDGSDPNDGSDVSDPLEALNVIGRLLAAGLIQLDGVIRMLNGDGSDANPADPAGGAQDTPAPAIEAAGGGAPPPDPKKKPGDVAPGSGGMQKLAPDGTVVVEPNPEVEELRKQVGDLNAKLTKVLALPQVPKGMLAEFTEDLAKSADLAGAEPAVDEQAMADALEKLTPNDRAVAMYKIGRGAEPRKVLGLS